MTNKLNVYLGYTRNLSLRDVINASRVINNYVIKANKLHEVNYTKLITTLYGK